MESGRDEVRVMTVHGAKGLEAPVVVVMDGCEPLGRNDPPLLSLGTTANGDPIPPVWIAGRTQDSAATAEAREALRARAREEHNRLLYVAMTRAADHLVIAPYRGATLQTDAAWCEMVRIGLERGPGPGTALETGYGPITLWRDGAVGLASTETSSRTRTADAVLPDWLRLPAAAEHDPAPPVSPSGALSAADGRPDPGRRQATVEARQRGKLIHSLVEHLPRLAPDTRAAAAARFVAARAPSMPKPKQDALVTACLRLFDEPDLAPLFAPQARAEVALSGSVFLAGEARRVFGRVDRLALDGDRVLVCDFKTGRPPAEDAPLPANEAAQIALYATLLGTIYPDRAIVPMLVWTSGPVLRRLAPDEVAAALATIGRQAA
jgi:ATP-dependent helicase/nuclease subunit A